MRLSLCRLSVFAGAKPKLRATAKIMRRYVITAAQDAEANALLLGEHHFSTQVDADNLGCQGRTLRNRRSTTATSAALKAEILAESS